MASTRSGAGDAGAGVGGAGDTGLGVGGGRTEHGHRSAGGASDLAQRLHATAHEMCFIARSVAFPVTHEPVIVGEA